MYSVLRKGRTLCVPIDIQILLFDNIVGGHEYIEIIQMMHLNFCKILLRVTVLHPDV